jgi:protein-L-isoaspartate(D-aspartate) O-methyltransferase
LKLVKKIAVPILRALGILPGEGRGQTNAMPAVEEDHFNAERQRMVQKQLSGPGYGITNARVLAAMGSVPRHEFVPAELRHRAYDDGPLPIGHGQTISQPFIVAFMTEQLDPKPTDRVLEIGTGSGYQAAMLAELAGEVYTIEIIEPLAQRAGTDLKRLGYTNIHVRAGDGHQGWPETAPFDAIIVTCAPEKVPPPLVEQLKDGGRMIIPVGPMGDQKLVLLRKQGEQLKKHAVLPVRFVPMTGGAQR